MKFIPFYLLVGWLLFGAETKACDSASTMVGDGAYFRVDSSSIVHRKSMTCLEGNCEDSLYAEIRIPYYFDTRFQQMCVEAIVTLPDGKKMTFGKNSFMSSILNDSCQPGTLIEFNLLELEGKEIDGQKFTYRYLLDRDNLKAILRYPIVWRIKPR
jgi:hypothetical protein